MCSETFSFRAMINTIKNRYIQDYNERVHRLHVLFQSSRMDFMTVNSITIYLFNNDVIILDKCECI